MLARTRRDCPLIARQFEVLNERLGQALERETWPVVLRWLTAGLARWDLHLCRGQEILRGSALLLFPVKPGSRGRRRVPPARDDFCRY
jgi:hypothetical protein